MRPSPSPLGQTMGVVLAGIFALVAFVIGPLVHAAVSREREYLADASAFEMTRFPDGLASALIKIESTTTLTRSRAAAGTHSFYFINPLRRGWLAGALSSHPPTEKRVARLREISRTF